MCRRTKRKGAFKLVSKRKVLYISHNHPSVRPGGAEAYALELYEEMRASEEFEPIFLAKGGPPLSETGRLHNGTHFGPINKDNNQYFFYTDGYVFDWLYGTINSDKEIYTKHFHEFLITFQPDVVHFQHTLHLGYDLIRQTRNSLPNAVIIYTLHEFLPICHRQGQMVRTEHQNRELCHESSPRRCHECFPDISPQTFFMRKRFVQSHFSLVDLFLVPSRFLLERYVEWGIPQDKIQFEEYGRRTVQKIIKSQDEEPGDVLEGPGVAAAHQSSEMQDPAEDDEPGEPRQGRSGLLETQRLPEGGLAADTSTSTTKNRVGFFGQLTPFKGLHVLLEAMKILSEEEHDAQLWLHGANLDLQPIPYQNKIKEMLEATEQNVTLVGRYDHDELPTLMASIDWVVMPSIWWENSPLVIQEAFFHGRPVICSDIGGMAEKVADGVNGLHFRVGDPRSLARTIRRATSSPTLWEALQRGIPEIYKIEKSATKLSEIYRTLLDSKTSERGTSYAG
jgi:glycosyltransferase involved in cell wall biosynthesis